MNGEQAVPSEQLIALAVFVPSALAFTFFFVWGTAGRHWLNLRRAKAGLPDFDELGLQPKNKRSDALPTLAGAFEGFRVKVTPEKDAKISVRLHHKLGFVLSRTSDGDIDTKMATIELGSRSLDAFFATRAATADGAKKLRNPGPMREALVAFVTQWKRTLKVLTIADGYIRCSPHVGYREMGHSIAPDQIRALLPAMVALAHALDGNAHQGQKPAGAPYRRSQGGEKSAHQVADLKIAVTRPFGPAGVMTAVVAGSWLLGTMDLLHHLGHEQESYNPTPSPVIAVLVLAIAAVATVRWIMLLWTALFDWFVVLKADRVHIPPLKMHQFFPVNVRYSDITSLSFRRIAKQSNLIVSWGKGSRAVPPHNCAGRFDTIVQHLQARTTQKGK